MQAWIVGMQRSPFGSDPTLILSPSIAAPVTRRWHSWIPSRSNTCSIGRGRSAFGPANQKHWCLPLDLTRAADLRNHVAGSGLLFGQHLSCRHGDIGAKPAERLEEDKQNETVGRDSAARPAARQDGRRLRRHPTCASSLPMGPPPTTTRCSGSCFKLKMFSYVK